MRVLHIGFASGEPKRRRSQMTRSIINTRLVPLMIFALTLAAILGGGRTGP